MRETILISLLVCVSIVYAVSNADPANIYNCDAMSSLWGCEPRFWTNGNRLNCQNKTTQLMPWATKTTRSNCYHIIVGEEASPATHYVPNEYLPVHIRVTCYKMLYRGILLYAVDSTEKKIGEWEIPVTEPPFFQQPWQNMPNHECAPSVMHATAEWKAYHSVLYFKAPAAGTGSVTFRCLFKYGNANTGDFFWPQTDVVLAEGTPKDSSLVWQQSDPGQSCEEACAGSYCNEEALQGLKDPASLVENIVPKYPCQVPLLSGCGEDGATYDPVNEYCYYVDSTCAAQNRTQSSVTCKTKQAGTVRLCPCDGEYMSPASHNGPGLLSMLFILPFLFAGLNQRVIFGLFLVVGISFGHNWIASISRSPAASTYRPCKPPLTDVPHAQVGPGQPFQIEWMNGHGDFTYFVIIHSRNADKLKLHTTKMLNDYIAKAPNGTNQALQPNLQRFHLKTTATLDNDFTDNFKANYFQTLITVNDSRYITRPATFGGRNLIYQFQYKAEELREDYRVSYRSTEYPWIEAVYKFKITTLNPSRPDTANFIIPGFGGPGRYIAQYLWRGYYDCVDVDYKTSQVADVYGIPFNGTRWTRIDHCLFENVQRVYSSSRIYTDPSACLNSCTFTDCYGVNVVPLMAPSSAYQGFRATGNTTMYPNIFGSDIYVPWNQGAFNNTRGLYTQNPSPTKYMCYTVRPRDFTDTQDEYTISNDPDDPIFYSTCFYRFRGNLFADYMNNTQSSLNIPWRYSSECIDCKSKAANSDAYNFFPKWNSPDVCVNCDKEPATLDTPVAPVVVETGVRCDGFTTGVWSRGTHHTCNNNGTNCWKVLRALGRNTAAVKLEECEALAAEDSSCSSHYVYRAASSGCWCYTKDTCCMTCSRRPDATYSTYELRSSPDPTCARGVLSTDRSACCSASCGAGNCNNSTAVINPVGFCCSTCATRPCSQYGPPCKM